MSLQKELRHESKKLRDSARGRECTIRIPGVCNHNPDTTVLCHTNGAGMWIKQSDLFGAFGCSSCHAVVDHAVDTHIYTRGEIELMHRQGVHRTQQIWLDEGLVKLIGEKP